VYNPGEQKELYERSAHLVESVFEGYNATFLAYGQTGTGKTHTVFGSEGIESGYFYSSVEDIFATIKKKLNERQFAVRISFV
jgi:kinesin family member 5